MLLDDYSLDKNLGKGAFGEVFLTTKKGTNKLFATKKIPRELVETDNIMKYLVNEIQILRELDHPNIVKFQEIKKTKNHYYIIMDYCNGGELYKALEKYMDKNKKPFSQEIVQHLMRQIINAFKYIHGKKIIHRDIKLENILLNYDSEEDKKNANIMKATVKIIDFGFAAKIEKSGLKYTTLGSPINMDPLILKELSKRGKKTRKLGYDQKADIWSLGTICYEMLIGKCVFNAEDLDELVDKVENGTYTVPTNLSKEVISFLNGMLQYDPNQRLNIEQLSNHTFLTKSVKSFEPIDIKKVKSKVDKSKLEINIKKNKSIWAIFNQEDEDKLVRISAQCFDKPIDEQASFVKPNLNNSINNNLNNNNNQNNNLNNRNNNQNNIQKMQSGNLNNRINNQNNIQKMQSGNLNNRINNQNNIQKMQSDNLKNINQNNNKNNMQNNNNLNNRNNMQNQKPNHNHNQNNDNKNNTNNNNDRFLGKQAQPQNKQFVPAYPYTYAPGGLYQGVQGVPMQRVVGMPVMAYTPMQPIQGYAMPTTAYAYYK